jgi:hypothetical protein
MDITQITAVIGAAASLLCTLVVGALTYFFKKTMTSLEEADKKNAADIQAEARRREQELKELTGQLTPSNTSPARSAPSGTRWA